MEITTQPQSAAAQPATAPNHFTLTPRAVGQVKEVMKSQGFDGYYLTVRVVPAGCSGLGYDLNLVKEAKVDDVLWEQDGIKLATDGMSTRYLDGTEVDYETSIQGAGFKFSNPNAKSSCGCGTSFTT
jgi:iron-sulfur cluster assembly protein